MIASDKSFGVTFRRAPLDRLRRERPAKIAVLVSNEYEGIFRNGGIGTYYRRLSEQLTIDGWCVVLLLTWAEKGFAGESDFVAVKHIFSTTETEEVLCLQPMHRAMLSVRDHDLHAYQSVCCLLFTQAVLRCFSDLPVYIEFPDVLGMGYHTIHAARTGMLGHNCITAVTMHGCHEWVYEASEKHTQEYPAGWLWQAAYCDGFSFENADLSFYPSHFLRAKVDSYGWETSRAVHLPYFVPLLDSTGSARNDLPTVDRTKVPVVFFGRLEERKGLCTFLEALRELPPAMRRSLHVLFLGKIVPLYSAPLAHLDSREYIEQALPPEVSYSILSDLYSAEALGYVRALPGAVVCLTSPQENFPNTGLEMGQLPIKLVVSDTGGFRETLGLVQRSAGVYWFEPKNPNALAEMLRRAIADEAVALPVMQPADIERTNHALLARKETLIQQALARAATVHVERPRVSLGVLWQGQAALMDCLASIDTQTYGDLDVIVLDNGGDAVEAREVLEHARALFPQYRFVRLPARLTAGAAWNQAVELADGGYFLGVEAETVLAPFAVAQVVKATGHAKASILSCPGRVRRTGEEIPGFSGGPLPRLMEMTLSGPPWFLGAVAFLRRFRRLEDRDTLTHGWEVLAAGLATGARIAYYPYPLWEARGEGEPAGLDEPARLKQQYQLRQYLAQIPPDQWCKRQLSLLLMAVQHLQAQVASRLALAEPVASPLPELQAQLSHAHADAAQLHAQLHDCHGQYQAAHATLEQTRADLGLAQGRITAMESSKFWKLRRAWFQLKRLLHLPVVE